MDSIPEASLKDSSLCIDNGSYRWKPITKFIKCQFESCSSVSSGGALSGSGDWILILKFCRFVECWSSGKTGAVEKSGGSFLMECCSFELCHGNGGNTESAGNAATATETASCWESVLFLKCWDSTKEYTDNTFSFYKGGVSATRINSSQCVSSLGSICGTFNKVDAGADISYFQCQNGENVDVLESWFRDQRVRYMNAINNSLSDHVFYQYQCTLTIESSCIFGNSKHVMHCTPVLINCVSDGAQGATIQAQETYIVIKSIGTCRSVSFTQQSSEFCIATFLCHFIIKP